MIGTNCSNPILWSREAMPTHRCDPRLDVGVVAATLRDLGYAARSYGESPHNGDPPAFGVAIHIVCTEAWRYPDGRWEIIDRPASLVAAAPPAPHTWLFNTGIAVPEPASATALAVWVAAQLPPPHKPEYRAYWHFSPPDPPPRSAPAHWARRWRDHWNGGGTGDITETTSRSRRHQPLITARWAAP